MKETGIQRSDIFVTSKLWNTYHRPELVANSLETTLNVRIEMYRNYYYYYYYLFLLLSLLKRHINKYYIIYIIINIFV